MITEFTEDKTALMEALARANEDLHHSVSMYAVLETEDPGWPFDIRLVHRAGEESLDAQVINERLFDRAFLDFGYQEVRNEDNLEGVSYKPIEDLFADPDCIGCAPFDFFDEDLARARMAHGIEEEGAEGDPDQLRFTYFLKSVKGNVIEGAPGTSVMFDDIDKVCGLLFKYEAKGGCIVAFQRTQPMWIQQKSAFLLFGEEKAGPSMFANRSLKLGNGFDFVMFDNKVFFRNLKALEVLFNFNKLAAQHAKDYADTFDEILADFEKIDERIDASRSVANKLLKMQKDGCPVAEMPAEELRYRVSRIGYYSRKIKFNEEGKVMLTSNANVSDFIKLLNDNFLISPLSDEKYEVRSKTRLGSDGI